MPRQNRVTPWGELIAVADRGMFWGNRGGLPAGDPPHRGHHTVMARPSCAAW